MCKEVKKHACINAKSASKNDRGSNGRHAMLLIHIIIWIIVTIIGIIWVAIRNAENPCTPLVIIQQAGRALSCWCFWLF